MPRKLPADFPKTAADWDKLAAAAPGEESTPASTDAVQPERAVVVRDGGPLAVREALVKRGRGLGKKPAKQQVTLRVSPDVLAHFKAGGPGWQARIDEALRRSL